MCRGFFHAQKKAPQVETSGGLCKYVIGTLQYNPFSAISAQATLSPQFHPYALKTAVLIPQHPQGIPPNKPPAYYIGLFNVQSEHATLKINYL